MSRQGKAPQKTKKTPQQCREETKAWETKEKEGV